MNYKTTIPILVILLISVAIPTALAEEDVSDLLAKIKDLQNQVWNLDLELDNVKLLATTQAQTINGTLEKLDIRTNQVGIQIERIKELEIQNAKYFDYMDELRAKIINSTQATVGKEFWEDHNNQSIMIRNQDMTIHNQNMTIQELNEKIERLTTSMDKYDIKVRHNKMYVQNEHMYNLIRVLDVCNVLSTFEGPTVDDVDHVELRKALWSGKYDLNSCLP